METRKPTMVNTLRCTQTIVYPCPRPYPLVGRNGLAHQVVLPLLEAHMRQSNMVYAQSHSQTLSKTPSTVLRVWEPDYGIPLMYIAITHDTCVYDFA